MRRFLSRTEVAERLGLGTSTLESYLRRGDFPKPDVMVGTTRGWSEETVRRLEQDRAKSKWVQLRRERAGASNE